MIKIAFYSHIENAQKLKQLCEAIQTDHELSQIVSGFLKAEKDEINELFKGEDSIRQQLLDITSNLSVQRLLLHNHSHPIRYHKKMVSLVEKHVGSGWTTRTLRGTRYLINSRDDGTEEFLDKTYFDSFLRVPEGLDTV